MNRNNLIYLLWTASVALTDGKAVIAKDPLWTRYDVNRYSISITNIDAAILSNKLQEMLIQRGFSSTGSYLKNAKHGVHLSCSNSALEISVSKVHQA